MFLFLVAGKKSYISSMCFNVLEIDVKISEKFSIKRTFGAFRTSSYNIAQFSKNFFIRCIAMFKQLKTYRTL